MADTSQTEVPPSQTNGLSDGIEDEERLKMRPADIDADVKEMERRKRVDMIMNSKLFREELERIIETQLKDGSGTSGLMQQISDMMGVSKNAGHVFKNSNCVVPINDIRGIESMGYAKGEKILRCKLAAVYRLIDLYGWAQGCSTLITARLNQDEEHFLVNPYGMLFHEITASSLIKVDMQGNVVEQGTTNFSVNITAFSLHAAIHSSRPDVKCIIHVHTPSVVAISALKCGLLPLSEESVVIGDISTHSHMGGVLNAEEIGKIARNLGPNNKVLLLTNQGAVCCGETIEEAFFNARNTVLACESQLKLMPMGVDNLVLITDEQRKKLYEAAHKAPESTPRPDQPSILEGKVERKWRVGGIEFEALMRMLDNAGFRTGYIYRHPLVKGEPPKPRNDVEVPPAVSSLGYLLEEEELYRQGLWKKLEGGRKGHDRTRWLNSPNVYQKVEILETGTPDPKKITKWVADGSPTHATTPVKIENALQFVPKNTNPKEFKQLQQQIKDYRRADKISAGPQSHILEGVTWEEAKKMQDATVTQTGDQVVLMGAASKGIIQRGFQHNATMYKSPYAKNPFDSVTDEELDEYKRVVERKTKGEFDDTTDYSESEGLSSAQINKRISDIRSPTSITSETEEESRDEPQILRIETTQAPKPSQPEVVMSDDDVFLDNTQEIVEQLKVSAIQNSPVSRVSVNSTRSMKVVRAYRSQPSIRNYYRTCSFSGLPKGSYLLPNPRHFHVAHYTNINKPMRPHVVNLVAGKYSSFNPNLPHRMSCNWDANLRPTVTINIANTRAITLNISMQTLREFIYPFAAALNLNSLPDSKTAASQTSYHIEQARVSVTAFSENDKDNASKRTSTDTTSSSFEEFSEFESQILQTMRDNILSEANLHDNFHDFGSTQTVTELKEVELCELQSDDTEHLVKNFTEGNLAGGDANEDIGERLKQQSIPSLNDSNFIAFEGSGYEASDELTMSMLEKAAVQTKNDLDKESKDISDTNLSIHGNLSNIDEVMKIAHGVTDTALKIVKEYSIFENVVNETLTLFKELPFPDDITKIGFIDSKEKDPEQLIAFQENTTFNSLATETLLLFEELPFRGGISEMDFIYSVKENLVQSTVINVNDEDDEVRQNADSNLSAIIDENVLNREDAHDNHTFHTAQFKTENATVDDNKNHNDEFDIINKNIIKKDGDDVYQVVCNENNYEQNDISEIGFIDSTEENSELSKVINVNNEENEIIQNVDPNLLDIINANVLNTEYTDDNHIIDTAPLKHEITTVDNNRNQNDELDIVNKNIISKGEDGVSGRSDSENNYAQNYNETNVDAQIHRQDSNFKNIVNDDVENISADNVFVKTISDDFETIETFLPRNNEILEIVEDTDEKIFQDKKKDVSHSTDTSDTQQYLTADDYSADCLNSKKEELPNKTKHSSDTEEGCEVELKNDADSDVTDVLVMPSLSEDMIPTPRNYTNEQNLTQNFPVNEANSDQLSTNTRENVEDQVKTATDELLNNIPNNNLEPQNIPQDSFDEGISDCKSTLNESTTLTTTDLDSRVITLAEIVYEYIVNQCYEITDLVLFPEVFYDENIIKMFSKLRSLYVQYYTSITDTEKNELRIAMTNYILIKIESSNDRQNCSNVSDKLFSISEFLSDIFDKFFDEYADSLDATDSWNGFSNLLAKKGVCQSTPEDKGNSGNGKKSDNNKVTPPAKDIPRSSPKNAEGQQEDLTAFQAKKSQSGCELYWISINKSPKNEEKTTAPRVVVNVDDIPLKPPDDFLIYKDFKRPLSPILEEAKCNLYNEFTEDKSPPQTPALSMHTEHYEYHDNTDYLAGGDYVQFDKPEVDVMMNEAKFFRGGASRRTYYVQSSSVTFHRNVELSRNKNEYGITCFSGEDCTDNDEGNWMGYEKAKF